MARCVSSSPLSLPHRNALAAAVEGGKGGGGKGGVYRTLPYSLFPSFFEQSSDFGKAGARARYNRHEESLSSPQKSVRIEE